MKDPKDQPHNVLITIAPGHRHRIAEVAQDLGAAGMVVAHVYPDAGTIIGTIPAGAWPRVSAVEGISDIEEEPIFRAM